mgnify:CR=1 FL=1
MRPGGQWGVFVGPLHSACTSRSPFARAAVLVRGVRWLGLDWAEGPEVGGRPVPYLPSRRIEGCRL